MPEYNLSEYDGVVEAKVVYIKAEVDPWWSFSPAELFRDFGYNGFDVKFMLE
jgi:hypothetical protein